MIGTPVLAALLPDEVRTFTETDGLKETDWDLLALTRSGCKLLTAQPELCLRCGTLLLPGDCGALTERQLRAERVVEFGLSPRDSLTFSSLGEESAVLCIQRALLRPDGGTVEPQEMPLGKPPCAPEELLAVMGARILLESHSGAEPNQF